MEMTIQIAVPNAETEKPRSWPMHVDITEAVLPRDTLFIHGNLASNRWWEPTLKVFSVLRSNESHGRAIAAEWRGSGRSAAPETEADLHPKVLALDYIHLCHELGVNKVNLVGHSTGGLIALYIMLLAPDLCDRTVLLDPVSARGVQFDSTMKDAFTEMSRNRDFCAQVLSSTIYNNHPGDPGFQALVDDAFSISDLNWHGVLNQLTQVDIINELPRIQTPTLVLHGEHDVLLPVEGSKEIAEQLPNGVFQQIPGQGHCTNFENPRLFVELMSRFLFSQS